MGTARIGELLGRLVPLSEQDISEILEAQTALGHRFGWIAMSWGLCRAEHVWQAWSQQLSQGNGQVDLRWAGIDTQTLVHVPAELARRFGVVPVRALDDVLILAARPDTIKQAAEELPALIGKRLQFVLADGGDVDRAIHQSYLAVESAERN